MTDIRDEPPAQADDRPWWGRETVRWEFDEIGPLLNTAVRLLNDVLELQERGTVFTLPNLQALDLVEMKASRIRRNEIRKVK